jgi:hypothetical protein
MQNQNQIKTRGGFKVKKALTLPVLKLKPGEEVYVQFTDHMHISKDTGQSMNGKKMEPATIANVIDLTTGEMHVLICATVMNKEIHENYPDGSYVGKSFAITLIRVPEKKYNLYTILEIEADEAQVEAEAEASKLPKGKK